MTPEELIEAVENLTHETYSDDPAIWLQWFNEALQDLSPVLRLETYEEFALNGVTERELPGDIQEIKKFRISGGGRDIDLGPVGVGETENKHAYWVWDGSAHFPEAKTGTAKLWYYRRPAKFTIGSARPDIQQGYEDALILYAAAKSKAPDRWLDDKNDFYRDYQVRKRQIELERTRQVARPRFARVGPFTAGGRFG